MNDIIQHYQNKTEQSLNRFLPAIDQSPILLHQAMHYAVFNGGKRIRPLLVYLVAQAFSVNHSGVNAIATAIEFIHCYSLVHDDLPAMDDDDMRRGKPSCHIQFDEANAILVGDALQALAFEIIAREQQLSANARLQAIEHLGHAIGSLGMVGGQSMDLAQHDIDSIDTLKIIHQLKTGALLKASVVLGAICADVSQTTMKTIQHLGECIGLAFQIQDDCQDKVSDQEQANYLDFMNESQAQQQISQLFIESQSILQQLNIHGSALAYFLEKLSRR